MDKTTFYAITFIIFVTALYIGVALWQPSNAHEYIGMTVSTPMENNLSFIL